MLPLSMVRYGSASAAGRKPLSETDLVRLLAGGLYNARIASLVHYSGINFIPTANDLELLRHAGADEALLHEVVTAPRVLPQVAQHAPEPPPQLNDRPRSVISTVTSTPPNTLNVRPAVPNSSQPAVLSKLARGSKVSKFSDGGGNLGDSTFLQPL
jgi:hypothetical protein